MPSSIAHPLWPVSRTAIPFLFAAVSALACGGDRNDPVGPASGRPHATRQDADHPDAVKGRVINAATGNPVAGAEVSLGDAVVITGPSGHFAFDPPEGER